MTRIVAASDLHGDLGAAERLCRAGQGADVVIAAGDLADRHEGLAAVMSRLEPIAGRLVLVAGNNETLSSLTTEAGRIGAVVLHGGTCAIGGITVGGLGGGVPPLPDPDWPSWDLGEEAAAALADGIALADVLVTHSPPAGVGDDHDRHGHLGSTAIRSAMDRLSPRLHVWGHVHDCWGAEGQLGVTRWRNLGPDPVTFSI